MEHDALAQAQVKMPPPQFALGPFSRVEIYPPKTDLGWPFAHSERCLDDICPPSKQRPLMSEMLQKLGVELKANLAETGSHHDIVR